MMETSFEGLGLKVVIYYDPLLYSMEEIDERVRTIQWFLIAQELIDEEAALRGGEIDISQMSRHRSIRFS